MEKTNDCTQVSEKVLKKIVVLEKIRLLDVYIKTHKYYAMKHNNEMERIDSILAKAPCNGCRTYDEADKLTDQSFNHFAKSKKHQSLYEAALQYKINKG